MTTQEEIEELATLVTTGQKVGNLTTSRTGKEYFISHVERDYFIMSRVDSHARSKFRKNWSPPAKEGEPTGVRITTEKLQRILNRLFAGEELKFQAWEKDGGISYTIAETIGVVFALRIFIERDDIKKVYRLKKALRDIDF